MSPKTSFPPDGIRRWFVGPDGIRSGWRVLIFAIPAYSFQKLLRMLTPAIQMQYDLGLISDSNLLDSIKGVEDNIRSALLNDQIRLQGTDIRPPPR
jgi:hypothetical protein